MASEMPAADRAEAHGPTALRAELEQSRDLLRRMLDDCEPRDAAALARELRMTLKELAEMAGPAKGSTVDALAAKRAARQSAAAGS